MFLKKGRVGTGHQAVNFGKEFRVIMLYYSVRTEVLLRINIAVSQLSSLART